ncbi:MAG: carboxypeptidase regulatory-like domain-containing protein [Myxococcales bacterium]|nr:carboxypeptidase regulatory-like domain-containing protein [Myxococcales bacterium]
MIEVKSGWSFPLQFTALLDGAPVTAAWTLDAPVGRITPLGGTFSADNTSAGVAQVSAEVDGQIATAEVEVLIVDDHPTCPPRPPLTDGPAAPGQFIKVVAPEYAGTGVYHGVYLPPDWTPGRRYPVIVESPCNAYQSFTGKVEDTRLGYYLSGCRRYIWIVLPYIQNQANLDYGWGELAKNLEYWQTNVRRALVDYGGDPGAVVVTGFSRGAIGASWIGLQDPAIADAWLGFFMHSHADVVTNLTPDGGAGSSTRMQRVAGRASLLSWGAAGDGGMTNSVKGVELLNSFGYPVTQLAVPNVGHTDAWIVDDAASREAAQDWLFATVAARPGTGSIYGRVTDAQGDPTSNVLVAGGPLHFSTTDEHGYYALRGLVPGMRAVTCGQPGCSGPVMIDVGVEDVDNVDFVVP